MEGKQTATPSRMGMGLPRGVVTWVARELGVTPYIAGTMLTTADQRAWKIVRAMGVEMIRKADVALALSAPAPTNGEAVRA